MTTSQAAAAASGPERTIRTRRACPWCSWASALHSPRRRRSVAPQTRSPVARSSRHCMPSQKHPQCFDHRRGWARGWAAWATMIAARPFNPVDQTGHQAACRWSHRALRMPTAQKSWAPTPSSAAAVMPESSLSTAPQTSENCALVVHPVNRLRLLGLTAVEGTWPLALERDHEPSRAGAE